eukprot:350149-Chlamydomonas_euryale.AAC.5
MTPGFRLDTYAPTQQSSSHVRDSHNHPPLSCQSWVSRGVSQIAFSRQRGKDGEEGTSFLCVCVGGGEGH